MHTTELYLSSWGVTIKNDVAYLSGTCHRTDDVQNQQVCAVSFKDAEAFYEPATEEVEAQVPGFIITTDYGVYWCSVYETDKYTLADTMNSLSRILPESIVNLLADEQAVRLRMIDTVNNYKGEHGMVDSGDDEY